MLNKELFEQCKRLEPKAQRALYDLYKARLMGLCRRYTRSTEDARDILQESFIKIFSKLHQAESAEKLDSWMKTITVRTAIDHYHRTKRLGLRAYSDKDFDVADYDYEIILENLSDETLLAAIHSLPEGCQLIFNLYEVEGYTHVEIADLLQVTEATSRSQLHRAKYLLKQKLSQLGITRYEKLA
ncbi:MAG TPA: RNA polymerase sigma factor [Chryseosolibacter sp.]